MVHKALHEAVSIGEALFLARDDVIWLLEESLVSGVLLLLVFQESPFEWLGWVKVDSLGHQALLVLQHLLARVSN